MGKKFERIEPDHSDFIARQQIFFNASAAPEGREKNSRSIDGFPTGLLDEATVS